MKHNWKDRLAVATKDEQVKVQEKNYAQKAMIIGDMYYKMECLKQEMAIINQRIIEIKGAKDNGTTETSTNDDSSNHIAGTVTNDSAGSSGIQQ